VKGAYLEPPAAIAYPRKADVDAAYERLLERCSPAAATPRSRRTTSADRVDDPLAERAGRSTATVRVPDALRRAAQPPADLARRGYKVLVATPYGPEWYPYLMRRLGERPANLLFFVKNTLRG
jgi:proline dehydrogenase